MQASPQVIPNRIRAFGHLFSFEGQEQVIEGGFGFGHSFKLLSVKDWRQRLLGFWTLP
jgi:hypothetical protein